LLRWLEYQLNVQLAYYPPYHSKHNPVERCWGVRENHWNGDVLDEIDATLNFAKTMTWKGKHPVVELLTQTCETGVKLTAKEMPALKAQMCALGHQRWPQPGGGGSAAGLTRRTLA